MQKQYHLFVTSKTIYHNTKGFLLGKVCNVVFTKKKMYVINLPVFTIRHGHISIVIILVVQ